MRSLVKTILGLWEGDTPISELWGLDTCPASSPVWALGVVDTSLENSIAQD